MIRKLVSSLLCAFALLLLMGAGVASEQTTPILAEEESGALPSLFGVPRRLPFAQQPFRKNTHRKCPIKLRRWAGQGPNAWRAAIC